jgi:hypothetical protein
MFPQKFEPRHFVPGFVHDDQHKVHPITILFVQILQVPDLLAKVASGEAREDQQDWLVFGKLGELNNPVAIDLLQREISSRFSERQWFARWNVPGAPDINEILMPWWIMSRRILPWP